MRELKNYFRKQKDIGRKLSLCEIIIFQALTDCLKLQTTCSKSKLATTNERNTSEPVKSFNHQNNAP